MENLKINKNICAQITREHITLKLIGVIQAVRNNLFHGGKIPFDSARDAALIKNSLIVLDYLLGIGSNRF